MMFCDAEPPTRRRTLQTRKLRLSGGCFAPQSDLDERRLNTRDRKRLSNDARRNW